MTDAQEIPVELHAAILADGSPRGLNRCYSQCLAEHDVPEGRAMLWVAQSCAEVRRTRLAKAWLERLCPYMHDLSDREVAEALLLAVLLGSPACALHLAGTLGTRPAVPPHLEQAAATACAAYAARMPAKHRHSSARHARQALLMAIQPVLLRAPPSADTRASPSRG